MITDYLVVAAAVPETAGQAAAPSPFLQFLPLVFLFVIFYFLIIRPQQKKQKDLKKFVDELKKGDKVVTTSGIIGIIAGIKDTSFVLKVGEGETKIEFVKSAVAGPAAS